MSATIRSFAGVITDLQRGEVAERADAALMNALDKLANLPRGEGTAEVGVTLKLKFKNGMLDIVPTVKEKLPEGPSLPTMRAWVTDHGISLQHPDQETFRFQPATNTTKA